MLKLKHKLAILFLAIGLFTGSVALVTGLNSGVASAAAKCYNASGTQASCDNPPNYMSLYKLGNAGKSLPEGCFRQDGFVGFVEVSCSNPAGPVVDRNNTESRDAGVNEDCLEENPNASNCKIIGHLVTFIKVLSGLVGVVVVTMIVVGGIQYSAASDNPQAVAAARGRIINALIALVTYIFMFAILQYLVPGGVL